jgi:hypothetical protein
MVKAQLRSLQSPQPAPHIPRRDLGHNIVSIGQFPRLVHSTDLDTEGNDDRLRLTLRLFSECESDICKLFGVKPLSVDVGFSYQTETTVEESDLAVDLILTNLLRTIDKAKGTFGGMSLALDVAHRMLQHWISAETYHDTVPVTATDKSTFDVLQPFADRLREKFNQRILKKPNPCAFCPGG